MAIPTGILQSFADLAFDFMLGVEDQDTVHFSVGDKQPIVVIDGKAVDPAEVGFIAIADELGIAGFWD